MLALTADVRQQPLFDDEWVSEAHAATLLGIQPRSLQLYRQQQRGPALTWRRLGRRVQYRLADVTAEARRRRGIVGDGRARLSTAQAARMLGVSESTLRGKRVRDERDLPWERDGWRVWYRAADVAAYAELRGAPILVPSPH